jgi:hypothetical protein
VPATSLLISHHEMQTEREHVRVRQLHRDIPELCNWYGAWWLLSADGWLRITDSHLASRLDRIQLRVDAAEEAAAITAARIQSSPGPSGVQS